VFYLTFFVLSIVVFIAIVGVALEAAIAANKFRVQKPTALNRKSVFRK
jgi:hypothetical protein